MNEFFGMLLVRVCSNKTSALLRNSHLLLMLDI
jgi:hypothetical protein